MTKTSLKGLLAAAVATVAGVAIAQATPPNPDAKNPAMGAGQRSTQSTPMGTTGTPTRGAGSSATTGATGSDSTMGAGATGSGSTMGASGSGSTMGASDAGTDRGTMAGSGSSGRTRADRN